MNTPDEIFRAWWDEQRRLVRIKWASGAELSLRSAELVTARTQSFTPDPPLVLVDMRGLTGRLDKAGRKHLLDELDNLAAMALLVDSPVTTMIANIFIRTQRRRVPMMLFTEEQDALDWLVARRDR